MSGGHWGGYAFEERILETGRIVSETFRLLNALEHELDWGICCDTCLDCAKKRMAEALIAFFDSRMEDATRAIALARDSKQNLCLKHGGV